MIDYSINAEENIIYCNISGETTFLDFTRYMNALVADKKYHLKLNTIINIDETTAMSYSSGAASIGNFFSQYLRQRKGAAWAFVMRSNITMGLAKLIMAEVDSSPIDVEYFQTEAEAKKWFAELAA